MFILTNISEVYQTTQERDYGAHCPSLLSDPDVIHVMTADDCHLVTVIAL